MGTVNQIVLLLVVVLVLVFETKPSDRGRGGERRRGRTDGSWKAPAPYLARIGTMNLRIARQRLGLRQSSGAFDRLASIANAPEDWRIPKPGGRSSDCGQRASVLECGGPPPLSMGARARNSAGSWIAMSESSSLDFSWPASFRATRSAM